MVQSLASPVHCKVFLHKKQILKLVVMYILVKTAKISCEDKN